MRINTSNQSLRAQGFTLIEVLLAVSITVIVAVMSYQGLDSGMRLAERSEVEADNIQRLNRVFDILAKDFRQIVARKVRASDGDGFEDAFYYNESSLPMLRFSRNGWTNPLAERFQRSQLQRVNYNYDGNQLLRQSWQMMDRYDDSEMTEIVLLKDVQSLSIRLLQEQIDPNAFAGGGSSLAAASKTAWVEQWPDQGSLALTATQGNTSGSNRLPIAIEITLEVEHWGKIRRVFEIAGGES